MKLLYLYMTSGMDGSRVHIDSFMHAFAEAGGEIIDGGVITPVFREDKTNWSLAKKLWVKFVWIGRNLRYASRALWLSLRNRPDAVLIRIVTDHQFFLAIALLSLFNPVVVEVNALRSSEEPHAAKPIIRMFDRWSLRCAERIFVVSKILQQQLLQDAVTVASKVVVIENGVDPRKFVTPLAAVEAKQQLGLGDAFVIGFTGSCKKWHGLHNMIALAKVFADDPRNIQFLIVGDGEERQALEQEVNAARLTDRVLFTGRIAHEQIPLYLRAMDVALAPYCSDSFADAGGFHCSPLKIFEYMAAGKAIIAAPLGQVSDLIVDGESGRLLPSEDVAALKAEIVRLMSDARYRSQLGDKARQRVEQHYTWLRNAEKVRALCAEAMAVRRSA